MKVRYTWRAQADLDAIFVYLDERAPAAALLVKSTIERRISRLEAFPRMAPETDVPGVHELTIVRYPYQV
jgi:plasmid stabilization system protein ParE